MNEVNYYCQIGQWFECAPWYAKLVWGIFIVLGGSSVLMGTAWLIFEGPTELRNWWNAPIAKQIKATTKPCPKKKKR